ncbi:helix-turn-helix domain-containing protein [Thalassospira australica]|uniref:helix-turn-helix domain-containing protein n=1 Tax=Thalassospira australica TaxID=1528106 RepID=UPI00051A3EF3|nr:XRE family transcriptional regulator [Thalassospira australica]
MNVDLENLQNHRRQFNADSNKSDEIGPRLHQLRKGRGWTLQDASKASGISASAFSKIERGELSPTISTIQRIARGFEMDVLSLLSDPDEQPTLLGRRSVTRVNEGKPHLSGNCDNQLLCADLKNKRMTPIRTRVVARDVEEYDVWPKTDAEIYMTVLSGTVVVHSKIYEPLELHEGDSMYYDASAEHVWTREGPEEAIVLWVLTS